MGRQTGHSRDLTGFVIGGIVFAFLWQFRLFAAAVLFGIAYICFLPLYDSLMTEHNADPSAYEMHVVDEVVPDFSFSRQNPHFEVDVTMENKGNVMIDQWTLYATLYECPRPLVPLNMCHQISRQGTWVTDDIGPGGKVRSKAFFDFWDNDDTTGQLRAVYSVGTVVVDSDATVDPKDS